MQITRRLARNMAVASLIAATSAGCGHASIATARGVQPERATATSSPRTPPASAAPAATAPTGGATMDSQPGVPGAPGANTAPRCTASALEARFASTGGAMGRRYGSLALTNKKIAACTLSGYIGMQMYDESGKTVPTIIVHDQGNPATVYLDQGQTAWTGLAWTVIPGTDEAARSRCQPLASSIAVMIPGDQTPVRASFAAGQVCEHGRVALKPLSAQPPAQ